MKCKYPLLVEQIELKLHDIRQSYPYGEYFYALKYIVYDVIRDLATDLLVDTSIKKEMKQLLKDDYNEKKAILENWHLDEKKIQNEFKGCDLLEYYECIKKKIGKTDAILSR